MKQMRRWISAWTMAGILVSTYPGPAVSVWASEPVLVAGSGMAEAVLEKGTGQGEEQVTGDWETDGDRGGAGETEMAAASSRFPGRSGYTGSVGSADGGVHRPGGL